MSVYLSAPLPEGAALTYGVSAGLDSHRSTIVRWETSVADALVAAHRNFNACAQDMLRSYDPDFTLGLRMVCHRLRCDGTNASVWQRQKLHVLECSSTYAFTAGGTDVQNPDFEERTMYGDLLAIEGGTGPDAYAMWRQQLGSLGVSDWKAASAHYGCLHPPETEECLYFYLTAQADRMLSEGSFDVGQGHVPPIEVWAATTDSGPYQVAASQLAIYECMNALQVWFLWSPCFMHQAHLSVKCHLRFSDSFVSDLTNLAITKYFSTLAVLMNCWRNSGKEVYMKWGQVHLPSQPHVKNVPPKCIGGRWGSVSTCEKKLLGLHPLVLREVFNLVAADRASKKKSSGAKAAAKAKAQAMPAGDDVDIAVEESLAYTLKLNSWWRRAVQAVNLDAFLPFAVSVLHRQRQPLDNLLNWLQKEKGIAGKSDHILRPGALALLVWGKGKTLEAQFHELFHPSTWDFATDDIPVVQSDVLAEGIVAGSALVAADFNFRVTRRLNSFPIKLLMFAKCLPSAECEDRVCVTGHRSIGFPLSFFPLFSIQLQAHTV
jgi:hypothetical protein